MFIDIRWRLITFKHSSVTAAALFLPAPTWLAGLRTHIVLWLSHSRALPSYLRKLWPSRFARPYDRYKSPAEEEQYWKDAAYGKSVLEQTDARWHARRKMTERIAATGLHKESRPSTPPLVMYYIPALLPEYRDAKQRGKRRLAEPTGVVCGRRTGKTGKGGEQAEERISLSAKNYVKWHWMVFPGTRESDHPSLHEAQRLKDTHLAAEKKVIDRIARMVRDYKIFPREGQPARKWRSKYRDVWLEWMHSPERKQAVQKAQQCPERHATP